MALAATIVFAVPAHASTAALGHRIGPTAIVITDPPGPGQGPKVSHFYPPDPPVIKG